MNQVIEQQQTEERTPDPATTSKWIRSRVCGCGDCRFYPMSERPICPMAAAPGAIQLWVMNSDYIGMKDYEDSYVDQIPTTEELQAETEVLAPDVNEDSEEEVNY